MNNTVVNAILNFILQNPNFMHAINKRQILMTFCMTGESLLLKKNYSYDFTLS